MKMANYPLLQNLLDLCNCPNNSRLPCDTNNMITFKFKDEMAGKAKWVFVGPTPKMFSIIVENPQKMSTKSPYRFAQISLKHGGYKRVLLSGHHMTSNNKNWLLKTSANDSKQRNIVECLRWQAFHTKRWKHTLVSFRPLRNKRLASA